MDHILRWKLISRNTLRCTSSLSNQGGAQTWEIPFVKQYEYKTDFNLKEWKGFTNGTKQVFVQKYTLSLDYTLCRNIKVVTQQFVQTNLHVSCLNKKNKLVIHSEQEFSFSTFAAWFKFPNLILLFLLILKCFQKVFQMFRCWFIVWYEMFTTTLPRLQFQLADQSMAFSISLVKVTGKCGQSAGCYFECWLPIGNFVLKAFVCIKIVRTK